GIVQQRLFTEGTDVKAGQVLFKIDPAHYQAVYDNAKAALGRSEANLSAIRLRADRMRELVAEKAVSQQEYDDAAAALKQNQADIQFWKATLETAGINLKYTSVTAPISGRIGKSNVTVGALVTANQPVPLATIQQLDPMYVDVPQSTTEILRLKRNLSAGRLQREGRPRNKVHILLEDGSRYPYDGTLQFRDVSVDQTTGSVILRVTVPNPQGVLLPGMFVRAVVEEGVDKNALLVPQQAVYRDPKGNPLVLLVDAAGKAEQRAIVAERAIGDQWLVTSGLSPGDRVIVEGLQKVRPGATVKAVPFADDAGKAGGDARSAVPAAPPAAKAK
ncbi:MAG TPA: efflux RND transporter periplasmic adaptor subunit, partial [Syntrophales bacterium]|nr:efflux RND transporter periplasmic adaptor subunit [Syntrophales bacterium]